MGRLVVVWALGLVVGACGHTTVKADGEPCSEGSDCASDRCIAGSCGGSDCDCGINPCGLQGKTSSDCRNGWMCVGTATNLLYTGTCRQPCGQGTGCPNGYSCEGDFCRGQAPESAGPVVTAIAYPEEAAVGEPIVFTAAATSDNGAIVSYEWSLGNGIFVEGAQVEHAFDQAATMMLGVTATDETGATGEGTVTVTICLGAGSECYPFTPQGACCDGLRCESPAEGEPTVCL